MANKKIIDKNGETIQEGDVIEAVLKRNKKQTIGPLFVKYNNAIDELVLCSSVDSQYQSYTLSQIAFDHEITVVDEHTNLYL